MIYPRKRSRLSDPAANSTLNGRAWIARRKDVVRCQASSENRSIFCRVPGNQAPPNVNPGRRRVQLALASRSVTGPALEIVGHCRVCYLTGIVKPVRVPLSQILLDGLNIGCRGMQ